MCGFGPKLCNMTESFYNNTCGSVALRPNFTVSTGVKQGCSVSPSLFILAADMLKIHIKNSDITKLNILMNKNCICYWFIKKVGGSEFVLKLFIVYWDPS